jgi:hypothetical protein
MLPELGLDRFDGWISRLELIVTDVIDAAGEIPSLSNINRAC